MGKACRRILPLILAVALALGSLTSAYAVQGGGATVAPPLSNWIQVLYNDQNGLPTGEANVVLQTLEGYLWIGGYGGLVRYDGRVFRNFSLEQSGISATGIRALFEDDKGQLWVGTNDQGVYLYSNGQFTPCPKQQEERYNSVRCFAQTPDGTIYVGTSTGLATIGKDNELLAVEQPELSKQTIYSLSVDGNGALWGTAGAGLAFALQGNEMVYSFNTGELSPYENYSVLASGDAVYIGTSDSLLLRLVLVDANYNSNSYWVESYDTGDVRTINAMCLTRRGELWLGGANGTARFNELMQLQPDEGLDAIASVNGIAEDYEGNMWLASTRSGVFKITEGKFANANQSAQLNGLAVNATTKADGMLYVGTDSGISIVDADWEPVQNELTEQLQGVRVRHVLADSQGRVWVSTYAEQALVCYTPKTGELVSITEAQGLLSNRVRAVAELANGQLAVATTAGVNLLQDGQVAASYGQRQGMDTPVILSLLETADGTLLAGSDGMGIYAIKDGSVTNIGRQDGLSSGVVLRMCEDTASGGVWISAGSSLFFMDSDYKVRSISSFQYGIGSIFDIRCIEDDIWLMKSSGIIIVPRDELLADAPKHVTQYGRESGLVANINSNSWNMYEDGVLYLSTVDGVYLFDHNQMPLNNTPPRVVVGEVQVQRESGEQFTFAAKSKVTLPSDAKRVSILFSCLSFGAAPCTVNYVLEGFDDAETTVLSNAVGEVSYTNLRGGIYTFRLRATNADGAQMAEDTVLHLYKERSWYENTGVWLTLGFLLALLIMLAGKLVVDIKTRQIKRRQQEYRVITEQALRTIAHTIDAKDAYTNGHSMRVADYARELARRMSLSQDEQENIYYTALLHDIGKIGIPDTILNKPGKLTDEEYDTMRTHTIIGFEILRSFTALPQIGDGALYHHENFDGSGYPKHLCEGDIPLVARIIHAADSYDAMASKRIYRDMMTREYIQSEFTRFSGSQFDPVIAGHMLQMMEDGFLSEYEKRQDTDG